MKLIFLTSIAVTSQSPASLADTEQGRDINMCGRARDFNGTRTRPDKHETVRCGETDTLTHTNCCKFKGDELEQRENIEVASVQAEFRDDNGCASLQVT